jgi:transposase-like protein
MEDARLYRRARKSGKRPYRRKSWPSSKLALHIDALLGYRRHGVQYREMSDRLLAERGVKVHYSTISRFLTKLLSDK